ncbi:hypothetical protein QVN76_11555 [Yersinia rochesterensis]|uniref:hypothetical protein n=1 Tax=Yersinia rochesterensis TaxID=1604335 RepID=UPI0025AB1EC2|nr:hypothetical protein [Yersinia rochesterensis]MDN0107511.1 hypothetical protein [Yersinia rochesterensis]
MRIIPTTFTSAMGLIIICFNASAIKPPLEVMNVTTKLIKPASSFMMSDNTVPPTFQVEDIKDRYALVEGRAKVKFKISTDEYINYFAYVRKNNTLYGEASGYINHSSKDVTLLTNEVNSGDYELVVEVYNNDQKSSQQTFDIRLGQ